MTYEKHRIASHFYSVLIRLWSVFYYDCSPSSSSIWSIFCFYLQGKKLLLIMLILSLIASLDSLPTLIWWYQIFFVKRKSNLLCCWLIPWVHCYIYLNWHSSFISFFFFFLLKHQLLSSLLCTLSLPAALQCIQPSFGGRGEKGREFGSEGREGGFLMVQMCFDSNFSTY